MSFPGWIVAGLGNPGRQHAGTRHDLGFMLVDRLAAAAGATLSKERDADTCKPVRIGGSQAILAKPTAFMNLSGPPLQGLMARERVPAERLLVACDDVNLPLGKLRLRPDGSAGGHNGLRSIIECIGQGFPRLRMGVGLEPAGVDRADWVLRRFEKDERAAVDAMLRAAQEIVEVVLTDGIEAGRLRAGG
jgi:PTH1 family peptidyl-tRNA hydrolase